MVINKIKFPLYGIIIVLAVFIGMWYIYRNLEKEKCKRNEIYLYFIMYIPFAFIFGKIYTVFAYGESDFLTAGLSAYGGLIGVIIAAIVYEKIVPNKGKVIKYTVLSLPLVYGITKIACAITGCCSGIPYSGLFKVKYPQAMNIWQFPVQITETIVFLLIFLICRTLSKNKNINYIVLSLVAIFKFLLDFLRYDHLKILITKNQIFSIILLLVVIIMYIINKNKDLKNKC